MRDQPGPAARRETPREAVTRERLGAREGGSEGGREGRKEEEEEGGGGGGELTINAHGGLGLLLDFLVPPPPTQNPGFARIPRSRLRILP